jgi:hypothetical protein
MSSDSEFDIHGASQRLTFSFNFIHSGAHVMMMMYEYLTELLNTEGSAASHDISAGLQQSSVLVRSVLLVLLLLPIRS